MLLSLLPIIWPNAGDCSPNSTRSTLYANKTFMKKEFLKSKDVVGGRLGQSV